MSRTISLFVLLGCAMTIWSCGSSPPVRYFSLQPISAEYNQDPEDAPIVVIGPLRYPDYLKRSQMVTRGAGAEMVVHDFSRWAEPLDQAMHRTVAGNVDTLVSNAIVVAYPTNPAIDIDHRLIGRIDRFDTDGNGLAVLDVQWSVVDADRKTIVSSRRSRYESRADRPGDPGDIAVAMSEAVNDFSRDIAAEIEKLVH